MKIILIYAFFSMTIQATAILSGKYTKLKNLDYFFINTTESADSHPKQNISILYHGKSMENITTFYSVHGLIESFTYVWKDRTHHFDQINSTHLMEIIHHEENKGIQYEWVFNQNQQSGMNVVEIAMITDVRNKDKLLTARKVIKHSFSNSTYVPPVYFWGAMFGVAECPTFNVLGVHGKHTPTKLVGISTAHFRIWQEFYRRHKGNDSAYILILEEGIHCTLDYCGDIALEHIKLTTTDILYLGWCNFYTFSTPPVCAHSYAINVKTAYMLLTNIFPCYSPLDSQLMDLAAHGKISWSIANIGETPFVRKHTRGLWRQDDW